MPTKLVSRQALRGCNTLGRKCPFSALNQWIRGKPRKSTGGARASLNPGSEERWDDRAVGVNFRLPSLIEGRLRRSVAVLLSLIHISEPTRQAEISYAVFCLK